MKTQHILVITFSCLLGVISCKPYPSLPARLNAVTYLNPGQDNTPKPVVVKFYALKKATSFYTATFTQLNNQLIDTLGADLVNMQQYEIQPNQDKKISIRIEPSMKYIGITANYYHLKNAIWRKVFTIKQPIKNSYLSVVLTANSLVAQLRKGGNNE